MVKASKEECRTCLHYKIDHSDTTGCFCRCEKFVQK